MKNILRFGFLSVCISVIRKLILTQFHSFRKLDLDYLKYEIVVEFFVLISVGFFTYIATKRIVQNNLAMTLYKTMIFATFYALVSFILTSLMVITFGEFTGFQMDFFHGFLKYLPNGINQGILFVLVMLIFQIKKHEEI